MTTVLVKWLGRLALVTAAVALLVVTAAIAILNSHAGTRWLIEQIDRRSPGELRIADFSGTLWSGLNIPLLEYEDASRAITARGLIVAVEWPRVSTKRIFLAELSASEIEYHGLQPGGPEPEPLRVSISPIPIRIGIDKVAVARFRYASGRDTILTDIDITGLRIRDKRIGLAAAGLSFESGSLALTNTSAELDGDVPISGRIAWRDAQNRWSGSGVIDGTLNALEFDQQVDGPYPALAQGTIRLFGQSEALLDATIRWIDWRYGDYRLSDGRLHIVGSLSGYRAEFDFQLADGQRRSAQLAGNAAGDAAGLSTLAVAADTPVGELTADGSLQWSPDPGIALRVTGRDFDLSQLVAVPQTSIGIDLTFAMRRPPDLELTVHSVDGSYNEQRFRARGSLLRQGDEWRCPDCEIGIGENRASIRGSLTDGNLAATVNVEAPSIGQLWPGIGGQARVNGTLRGPWAAPIFTGKASGADLALTDWRFARVSIDSRASTLERLDFAAVIEGARRLDRDIGNFDLSIKGPPSELQARIGWMLEDISGEARGSLDVTSEYPRGTLKQALIAHPKAGAWTLSNAFDFAAGRESVEIGAHSWTSADAELRIDELVVADGRLSVAAKLAALPLTLFQPLMPENAELAGRADSDIRLSGADRAWTGTISWSQRQTRLRIRQPQREAVDIVIPELSVDARFTGDAAEATASIAIEPGVSGVLHVSASGLTGTPDIDARMTLDGNDWHWIPAVLPQVDRFEGAIGAEIRARGKLPEPAFSGELRWRGGSLLVPALNLPITDIELVVSGAPSGNATVKGQARAGGGRIDVDGRLDDLMRSSRSFALNLTGTDAELLNWPEYKVTASPTIQLSGNRDGVSLAGSIEVPRAEIAVRRLPEDAVTPSPDVIVPGRSSPPETQTRLTGHAEFILGDNVKVSAFGLDTKLAGRLGITANKDRSIRAEGELTLKEGVFEAYGQRLTITNGTLLFTGPLDDPIVTVRAVRKIETTDGTVTAGIDLHGRAQNLVATVFSDPVMAEADALSYLVLGRPLEQATTAEGGQLSGAALALGLRQAGRITNQIGQAVGLDQLDVSGDGGSTTALVAGKQVNSRLYARYAYGVFSQLGSLLLRYRLSRHLTLEASTGEAHSMDVVYIVEKP